MTRESAFPRYARLQYRVLRTLGYTRAYARCAAIQSRFVGHQVDEDVAVTW